MKRLAAITAILLTLAPVTVASAKVFLPYESARQVAASVADEMCSRSAGCSETASTCQRKGPARFTCVMLFLFAATETETSKACLVTKELHATAKKITARTVGRPGCRIEG